MLYLILKRQEKRQETGIEHVAIATSKCVPSGMFCRVQHPCQVSTALLIIGGDILNFVSHHCTRTTGDVVSD